LAAAVALALATATALSAPGNSSEPGGPKMFGKGRPFDRVELPPGLRKKYDALPESKKRIAEQWLQRFSFPENDGDSLHFDREGAVLYVDPFEPEQAPDGEEASLPEGEPADVGAGAASDAFHLHSRPGSPNAVYLDFDGHTITGTAWNGTSDPLYAKPFDLDGSPSTYSDAERSAIAEIWHRVAEDYAAFDLDVTTEEPASFGRDTGRVLITSKRDGSGRAMPYDYAGGVAYVGVWGRSNYASYYSPALVYFDNLAKATTYIAEACAHELGHNLGLSHDGTGSVTYYKGHGSGYTSWAPIMGNSYYNNVTQWSRGEYAGANNTQDDIAVIVNKLKMIGDDHGDKTNDATPLVVEGSGEILVSNPETDPHNGYGENKGVIEALDDVDMFMFRADAGPVGLTIVPAWDAFYRTGKRGANLDVRAVLRDQGGVALASSDPTSNTDATIATTVAAGTYYLEVSGVGNGNYSDYASAGQYFVSGSIVPSTATNARPSASFDSVCSGADCGFSDSSTDPDGRIVSWGWDFDDGTASTAQNPTHTYAEDRTYAVTLTVTDDAGARASTSRDVSVTVPNAAPTAVFTPSCSDLSCTFTDNSSDIDGSIDSWSWRFGDETASAAQQNPSHTYAAYGTYSVTLTVTDNEGSPASETGTVKLAAPKVRGKSGNKDSGGGGKGRKK
jgi:PKD repeat protein